MATQQMVLQALKDKLTEVQDQLEKAQADDDPQAALDAAQALAELNAAIDAQAIGKRDVAGYAAALGLI